MLQSYWKVNGANELNHLDLDGMFFNSSHSKDSLFACLLDFIELTSRRSSSFKWKILRMFLWHHKIPHTDTLGRGAAIFYSCNLLPSSCFGTPIWPECIFGCGGGTCHFLPQILHPASSKTGSPAYLLWRGPDHWSCDGLRTHTHPVWTHTYWLELNPITSAAGTEQRQNTDASGVN